MISPLVYVQRRLESDRHLMAEVISALMTEEQLASKPACLKGLSVREAWVSWSAGFTPQDKFPKGSK
jgi:hypothetical protein